MSKRRKHVDEPIQVATDLVEYLIVAAPDPGSLAVVGGGLAELVRSSAIRILDLVVLVKDAEGVVAAIDPQSVEAICDLPVEVGSMLSAHDLELAALALRPSSAAVVLVSEDRWARPLSVAAQRAGGQIVAGERIPSARVVSALAGRPGIGTEGG
ncbi:MAG TPA: DUF6325 family protein [Ilumatobacteraceae bacterium]|nr:DUF6325 family protein [Ilumatobacteraceae bacterium]